MSDSGQRPSEGDLYVSPSGDDDWSGTAPEPTDDGGDGPFRTIERARDAIRERKRDALIDGEITVWLRGGRYPRETPLRFTDDDSAPVRYAAFPGEEPIVDGGRRVEGWQETTVEGVEVWKTVVPEVADGDWYFKQLFVDGKRATRPRLPKVGDLEHLGEDDFYWIDDLPGFDADDAPTPGEYGYEFRAAEGDVRQWHNVTDVDVVALRRWFDERLRVAAVDPETNRVEIARRGANWGHLVDEGRNRFARYYVENVFEALSEPGEWYLDRRTGECYYVPREGETIDDVEAFAPAPSLTELLVLRGRPDANDHVEHLSFEGLRFRHAAWEYPPMGAKSAQAKFTLGGAITLEGARHCSFEDCTIEHVGQYGIEIRQGCTGVRVVGNELADLGGGGIKMNGSTPGRIDDARDGTPPETYGPEFPYPKHEWYEHPTGRNRITDNHVHHGGRVFHCGVGVLAMHTFGNHISHNHVHDLYYTGISCGWTWGYEDCVERDNRIEYNHIHDLGHELLSDMGGIYTLGVQPGTVIRGNHVHDIEAWNYGAWPIYPDQGSSHLLVEKNVCHDTNGRIFNQHFGRENVVRNNVFAFGEEAQAGLYRAEDHVSFTLERNVLVTDGEPIFGGGYAYDLEAGHVYSDLNLLWDVEGRDVVFGLPETEDERGALTLDEWRDLGYDRHSVVADPEFADVDARDFGLSEGSPAFELGFEPLDPSLVGPRSSE